MCSPRNSPSAGLDLHLPWPVLAALAFYVGEQLLVLANLRGVADQYGFLLNTSKLFGVNTFEEDGALNVFASLGYFATSTNRFASYINIGGPFLILGEAFMRLAAALGFVTRFPEPWLYLAYPQTLVGAWKAFGVYKLALSTLLPLAIYWYSTNHLSRRAGIIAVWLFVAMPFLPGFEARLKVDSVCIALGLLSLAHQLEWLRSGRERSFLLGLIFLALSMSMKFVMASALALLSIIWFAACRRAGTSPLRRDSLKLLLGGCIAAAAVFLTANPFFVKGLAGFLEALSSSKVFLSVADIPSVEPTGWAGQWFRLTHYDAFFGPVIGLLAIPCLSWALFMIIRGRGRIDGITLLLLCFVAHALYLGIVARNLVWLTYYSYFSAVILLILIAAALDLVLSWLGGKGRVVSWVGIGLTAVLTATSFVKQAEIVRTMLEPTNRESAHALIERTIRPGTCIGVPLDGQGGLTDSFHRIDPFRYRVVPLTSTIKTGERPRPSFALMAGGYAGKEPAPMPGYSPRALLDAFRGLNREYNALFQDEPFILFETDDPALPGGLPGESEAFLGKRLREDREDAFNILQYNALSIFPISLDLLRKEGEEVLPLPTRTMSVSARQSSSPLSYVHQIDQATLNLWGVKYIFAKLDQPFMGSTLNSGRFALLKTDETQISFQGEVSPVGLFLNKGYTGQAFFAPDAPAEEIFRLKPSGLFGRRPIPSFGRLLDGAALKGLRAKTLEIRITLETDGPVDIQFKGASWKRSILVNAGFHSLNATYEVDMEASEAAYEVNPVTPGTRFTIKDISARPLRLYSNGTARPFIVAMENSFVSVSAPVGGRLLLALPFHPFWRGEVNGQRVMVERGPGDVTAIPVPPGSHVVSLRLDPDGGWR